MKVSSFVSLLFVLPVYGKIVYGKAKCSSLVGNRKPKGYLPTTTKTVIHTYSLTQTITTQATVTYTPVTTVVTTTSICARTTTKKYRQQPSTYVTSTSTETIQSSTSYDTTVTSTYVTTVTPPPYTSTVPAPYGFVPILSEDTAYLARRQLQSSDAHKRGLVAGGIGKLVIDVLAPQQTCSVNSDGNLEWYPPVYTTAVSCIRLGRTSVTATTTVQDVNTYTSTAYPTVTKTKLVTKQYVSTVTSYIVGGKTKTFSVYTTTTTTDWTTTTNTFYTTETSTCTAPAAPAYTEYAICSDDNVASHYSTPDYSILPICTVMYNTSSASALLDFPSAKACCNLCAGTADCAGSVWSAAQGTCVLVGDSGVCDPTVNYFYGKADGSIDEGDRFFLSNGPCGRGSIGTA